jgi:hypothetical protein
MNKPASRRTGRGSGRRARRCRRHVAADHVVDRGLAAQRTAQPNHRLLPACRAAAEIPTFSIVDGPVPGQPPRSRACLELLDRSNSSMRVRLRSAAESARRTSRGGSERTALVVVEAEPLEPPPESRRRIDPRIARDQCPRSAAQRAAMVPGEKPVEQSCTGAPQVEETRRARCETRTNSGHCAAIKHAHRNASTRRREYALPAYLKTATAPSGKPWS